MELFLKLLLRFEPKTKYVELVITEPALVLESLQRNWNKGAPLGHILHIFLCKKWSYNNSYKNIAISVFLAAEDVNIIVLDWSLGASAFDPRILNRNTIASGAAVGAFINWLNQESGSSPVMYHIIGHGVGGHQAGIIGRNVDGDVAYITGEILK